MVWFVDAAIHVVLFVVGRRLLTTERLEAARAQQVSAAVDARTGVGRRPTAPS